MGRDSLARGLLQHYLPAVEPVVRCQYPIAKAEPTTTTTQVNRDRWRKHHHPTFSVLSDVYLLTAHYLLPLLPHLNLRMLLIGHFQPPFRTALQP